MRKTTLSTLLLILVLSILTDVCYSANWDKKNGKQFINRNQAKIDVLYFFDKFETVHPDPYYFCSKVSLDSIKWNLIENIPDSITVYDFWKLLNIKLKPILDAHTRFDYLPISIFNSEKGLLFPTIIKIDSNNNIFMDKNKKIISMVL